MRKFVDLLKLKWVMHVYSRPKIAITRDCLRVMGLEVKLEVLLTYRIND